jgi:hypothetical protein
MVPLDGGPNPQRCRFRLETANSARRSEQLVQTGRSFTLMNFGAGTAGS